MAYTHGAAIEVHPTAYTPWYTVSPPLGTMAYTRRTLRTLGHSVQFGTFLTELPHNGP